MPEVITEKEADVLRYACWESYITWKSAAVLKEGLKEHGMEQLMREIEMPLVFVLSDMEQDGICIDANALKEYGQKLSVSIGELEQKIYEEAGETFNINSPKQLGVILFEKMQLPNGKKTKTGFSTSAEVLEKLAGDYPIVADILEYRKLSKLKSTYADGLSNFIDATGKIHTTFHQTITATGRLSSTDPNLQNIPIRIELGKMIRKVFHPMPGDLFVDSDYSQIELRLLAHMSGDEQLIEAFRENQDIHRSTASKVFHVPFDEVTDLQRRNAKAVNFGIVYGISAYGLSQDLNIGTKGAQGFINSVFAESYADGSAQEIAKKYGVQDSLLEQEPCEFKQSESDSDVDYIKSQGKMIVGITEFEPMDYKDKDDKWIGFDADMARLVGEKLGVDVEFVVIDWDNKVMELDSKKIDVVWNGMTLTDEVTKSMECTNAYCNNAQVVVEREK